LRTLVTGRRSGNFQEWTNKNDQNEGLSLNIAIYVSESMGENDGTRGTLNILNLSSSNGASGEIISEFAPSILKSGLSLPHGHIDSIPKASCLINLISLFFSPTPSRRVESYIIIHIQ
jgi:hypothetical protein